jgi:transcriptional regulator with XRE-family HTH domain
MGAKTVSQAFGIVLRECREKARMTQEELALEADLDRTYISLLERGLRQPTLETLFSLAGVLKIAPATLVARTVGELG